MSKKKIVLGAVVILGAAYVGASWYVGSKTEQVITEQLQKANQKLAEQMLGGDYVRIEQLNYDSGIFSSSAVYAVKTNINGTDQEFRFSDHYSHGPFPFAALTAGIYSPMLSYNQSALLNEVDGVQWYRAANGDVPLKAISQVQWDGAINSHFMLAPLKTKLDESVLVETSKADLHLAIDSTYSRTHSQIEMPWIGISEADNSVKMLFSGIGLDSVSNTENDVVSTAYTGALQRIEYSEDGVVVMLDNLNVQGDGVQSGFLITSATINSNLEKLLINNSNYGSFNLGFGLKNIDLKTLQEFGELSDQLEEDPNIANAYMTRLLESKPEISLQPFAWKNSGGESVVNAQAALQPGTDQEDPFTTLNSFTLDASIPRAMVAAIFAAEQGFTRSMIELVFNESAKKYAELGLVTYQNNIANVSISYNSANQTVVLNGKEMTTQAFMLLMTTGLGQIM